MLRRALMLSTFLISIAAAGCQAKVPADARALIDTFISASVQRDKAMLIQSSDSATSQRAIELMADPEVLSAFKGETEVRQAWRKEGVLYVKVSSDSSYLPLMNLILVQRDYRWVINSVGMEFAHAIS